MFDDTLSRDHFSKHSHSLSDRLLKNVAHLGSGLSILRNAHLKSTTTVIFLVKNLQFDVANFLILINLETDAHSSLSQPAVKLFLYKINSFFLFAC